MTLKGKQNHYNVKYLSGYGISIKQKDNQIILQHKPDPFSEPNTCCAGDIVNEVELAPTWEKKLLKLICNMFF